MKKIFNNFLVQSSKVGCNWMLCQATGGNTSFKYDGEINIKASGYNLRDSLICPEEIFVNPKEILGFKKPSMEYKMHIAIPHKYVFHYHPLRFILCSIFDELQQLKNKLDEYKIKTCILPYVEPGDSLAFIIEKYIKNKELPDIIFLMNHGVVVSGNNISSVKKLILVLEKISFESLKQHIYLIKDIENSWGKLYETIIKKNKSIINNNDIELVNKGLKKIKNNDILFPDQVIYLDGNFASWGDSNQYFTFSNSGYNSQIIFEKKITNTQKEYLIALGFLIAMIGSSTKQISNVINEKEVKNLKNNPKEIYRKNKDLA